MIATLASGSRAHSASDSSSSLTYFDSNAAHGRRGRSVSGRDDSCHRRQHSSSSSRQSRRQESPILAQPPSSHNHFSHASRRSLSRHSYRPAEHVTSQHGRQLPYTGAAGYAPKYMPYRHMHPKRLPGHAPYSVPPQSRPWQMAVQQPMHMPAPYCPMQAAPSPDLDTHALNAHQSIGATRSAPSSPGDNASLHSNVSVRSDGVILPVRRPLPAEGVHPADGQGAARSVSAGGFPTLQAPRSSPFQQAYPNPHIVGHGRMHNVTPADNAHKPQQAASEGAIAPGDAAAYLALAPEHSYQKQAASQVSAAFSPTALAQHRAASASSAASSLNGSSEGLSTQVAELEASMRAALMSMEKEMTVPLPGGTHLAALMH
jgi:hypothetical protein